MAYSIIGIKKQHTMADLAEAGAHNERSRDTPNANPARRAENERLVGSGDLCADVEARLDAAGVTKVRANGIRAVEIVQTASPEWFHAASPEQLREWVTRSVDWLKGRYGENLVSSHLHMDETSPNIHAMVVPITPDGKLSHKKLFGDRDGPAKLAEAHTSYNRAVAGLGLERGTERSKATHMELQDYYHRMGRPTREAWELARQVTIAPAQAGEGLEERLARTIAPEIAAERTRAAYWRDRAEQTERQLQGERGRNMRHAYTREEYGEIIERVRATDLVEVMQGLGATRDRYDRDVWHLGTKKINIQGDKYYDFHAPESDPMAFRGGAIDLVRYTTGRTFTEAVDHLNSRHYGGRALEVPQLPRPTPEQVPSPALPGLPEERPERWAEVRRYLVEGRRVPADLVDQAHGRGDVYATEYRGYPNAVFVRRDQESQAVGAFIRGTRGDFRQSTKREGYFSVEFGTPNRARHPDLVLVESPIDALSYAALHREGLSYGRVLSTDGRGPLPSRQIEEALEGGGTVRAAFDNDGPDGGGARLWQQVRDAYPEQTSGDFTPIMRQMPKAKDWNEDLQRGERGERKERSAGRSPETGGHRGGYGSEKGPDMPGPSMDMGPAMGR